jgi:hypothetical protein
VLVEALDSGGATIADTRTCGEGVYELRVPSAKVPVRMRFTLPGYFNEGVETDVEGLATQNIVMALINPDAAGAVTGRVTGGESGGGIANATVRANGDELGRRTVTNASGTFLIEGMPTGQYTLEVTTQEAERQSAVVSVFANGAVNTRDFVFGEAGEGTGEGIGEGTGEGDTEGMGDGGCPGSAVSPPDPKSNVDVLLVLLATATILLVAGRTRSRAPVLR